MPTTNLCENCHTTGIGTKTPSWVPSSFDHTQMTVTTCQTCHSGTRQDLDRLRLRAADQSRAADSLGHRLRRLPRQQPGRGDLDGARREHPDAAHRTAGEQLPAVPRRGDLRGRPGALHSDVDFRRVADQDHAARAAAHSDPRGHRLQRLPRRGLSGRRLRSGDGHERRQARLRVHDLRYLPRHRQELLCRQRHAAAAAAGGSREQQRSAHGDQRLLGVPRDQGLGQHGDAGRPHAESEQPDLRAMPYLRAERLHAGDARGERACCTPASPAIAGCATATRRRRSPGPTISRPRMRCSRRRIFRTCRAPIAVPAMPSNYVDGRLRPHEHERGQARVRADLVRHLP